MFAIDDLEQVPTEKQPVDEVTLKWQQTVFRAIQKETDLSLIEALLREGDINFKKNNEYSPLLYACKYHRQDIVELLIDLGADVNSKDFMNETALFCCAQKGWLQIAKFLVFRGADVNATGRFGQTPLFAACMFHRLDVLQFLLDSGANPNIQTKWHATALHLASKTGRVLAVKMLVNGGADVNARSDKGTTPLHETSFPKIAEILIRAGADCNLINKNTKVSSFHNFICHGLSLDLLKMCIEYGAYIRTKNYRVMVSKPEMKEDILRDSKLCALAIANRFNSMLLPIWYKVLPVTGCLLPSIDKFQIGRGSKVFEDIELLAKRDIEANGHCIVPKIRPIVLSMMCIKSLMDYYLPLYKMKSLEKKQLKRVVCPDAAPTRKSPRLN